MKNTLQSLGIQNPIILKSDKRYQVFFVGQNPLIKFTCIASPQIFFLKRSYTIFVILDTPTLFHCESTGWNLRICNVEFLGSHADLILLNNFITQNKH